MVDEKRLEWIDDPAYLLPGVDGEGRMWFHVYKHDSDWARANLPPGSEVLIRARVGDYWSRLGEQTDSLGLDGGSIRIVAFYHETEGGEKD